MNNESMNTNSAQYIVVYENKDTGKKRVKCIRLSALVEELSLLIGEGHIIGTIVRLRE